jgi:hypothetical protein
MMAWGERSIRGANVGLKSRGISGVAILDGVRRGWGNPGPYRGRNPGACRGACLGDIRVRAPERDRQKCDGAMGSTALLLTIK